MSGTPVHYPQIPSWRTIGQAIVVAVYVCACTFFGGLIGQGGGIENWADWKIAVEAGISAGLAFLGFTVASSAKR